MTAMANMGNLVVALPPSDIWLTDEQAADFWVMKTLILKHQLFA